MEEKTLKSIISRLDRLEKSVFAKSTSASEAGKGKKIQKTSRGTQKSSLPSMILELKEKGFFKEPRDASETHKKLMPSYHCEENRVSMALLRLSKKRHLRKAHKTKNNKKILAYVW